LIYLFIFVRMSDLKQTGKTKMKYKKTKFLFSFFFLLVFSLSLKASPIFPSSLLDGLGSLGDRNTNAEMSTGSHLFDKPEPKKTIKGRCPRDQMPGSNGRDGSSGGSKPATRDRGENCDILKEQCLARCFNQIPGNLSPGSERKRQRDCYQECEGYYRACLRG